MLYLEEELMAYGDYNAYMYARLRVYKAAFDKVIIGDRFINN